MRDLAVSEFRRPFSFAQGSRSDLYAAANFAPAFVSDFLQEVYRVDGAPSVRGSAATFGASGLATMLDADGRLKWRPHNLVPKSAARVGDGWTSPGSPTLTEVAIGEVIVASGGAEWHRINAPAITLSAGVQYTLAGFVTPGTSGQIFFEFHDGTSRARLLGALADGQTLTEITTNTTIIAQSCVALADGRFMVAMTIVPQLNITAGLGVGTNSATVGETITVHDLWAFRSDLGGMADNPSRGDSYVPTEGTAVYIERDAFQFDGIAWPKRGVLGEPLASTSGLIQSKDFADAAWFGLNTGALAIDAMGPDGQISAVTLVDNAASGTGPVSITETVTVATASSYTFSIFAKADQLSWLSLQPRGFTTPADGQSFFDLGNGAVGSVGAEHWARIEGIGNGWYRCSVSFTTDAADTTGAIDVRVAEADGDAAVDLDGTSSIQIFGAQFEQGPVPTSYIPTAGATATRAAETLALALPFDATAMSGLLDVTLSYADTDDVAEQTLLDWRVDASNRITLTLDTSGANTGKVTLTVVNGGTPVSVTSSNDLTPGLNVGAKVAWRITAGEINIALNGTVASAVVNTAGIPDLSSVEADLKAVALYAEARGWTANIGDTGIEEAST